MAVEWVNIGPDGFRRHCVLVMVARKFLGRTDAELGLLPVADRSDRVVLRRPRQLSEPWTKCGHSLAVVCKFDMSGLPQQLQVLLRVPHIESGTVVAAVGVLNADNEFLAVGPQFVVAGVGAGNGTVVPGPALLAL